MEIIKTKLKLILELNNKLLKNNFIVKLELISIIIKNYFVKYINSNIISLK